MTKKTIIILIVAAVILVAVPIIRFVIGGDEDTWICTDGQWIKHGNPSSSAPTTGCGNVPDMSDLIKVSSPKYGEKISSPLMVTGEARGPWYFEASFPVKLLDGNGNLLAQVPAQAKSDWMTEDFVPFEAKLEFTVPSTSMGYLVLNNDNPSGLAENNKELRIPIKF